MTFDDIEIDGTNFELRRNGEPVAVEPKVFDLIRFFSENPNRLVSKDELIEAIWQGRIVSDAALSTAIKMARKALGDTDVQTSRIQTVRGRGFRMVLPDDAASNPVEPVSAAAVQPAFVVLTPGGRVSADDAAELQRRLSLVMARVPFIRVVPPVVASQLSSLGQGFALEINGRTSGNQTILDCLLFDAQSSSTLWTFETQPFDPATGLEATITEITTRLEPQVVRAMVQSLAPSEDARVMALRGLGTMNLKGWNAPAFLEAETILRDAIDKDEALAFAHAGLSLVMALGQQVGFTDPAPERRETAIAHAERAIDLDGMSTVVLGLAGCALCDAGQAMRGKTILERALNIDAGHPQALAALGAQVLREQDAERAVNLLHRAITTAPQDNTLAVWRSILALAHLGRQDIEAALAEARRAVQADDQTHLSRVTLAAIHLAREDAKSASDALSDAYRVTPDLTHEQIASVVGQRLASGLAALAEAKA